MSLRARGILIVITVAVAAVAAAYYLRLIPGTGHRTTTEIGQLAERCNERLSPLVQNDVFAGAERAGSEMHILAVFAKWSLLDPLDWIGTRLDVERIIIFGDDFERCHMVDSRGNVVATHSRHKGGETNLWFHRSTANGQTIVTLFEQEVVAGAGKKQALHSLAVDTGSHHVTRLHLNGEEAGRQTQEGTYHLDAGTRRFSLSVGQEEKAELTANGLLATSHYRSCFDPAEVCGEPWETTRYTYDDAGNLIARERDLGGVSEHHDLVIKRNDRGDWIEWSIAGTGGQDAEGARRILVYRN